MEYYIGEIRPFAYHNLVPQNWAACNGQILSIADYPQLYSLIGTSYGGNGTTTFALPNLNGRTITCITETFEVGKTGGSETVTLTTNEMPQHTHLVNAANYPAHDFLNQNNDYPAEFADDITAYTADSANIALNPKTISFTGGGQAHENRMPFMVMNFYIATKGIYPEKS